MPPNEEAFQKAMNEGNSAAWDEDWEKAAAAYEQALQASPDQPRALNSLGMALYQLGKFEEALQAYQRVTQLSPDDPAPLEKVAQISERLGDVNGAAQAAMQAAEAYLKQRDINKALENWSHVTALKPEQPLAHSRLATAHERLGHPQQAVTEYLAVASLLQRLGNPEKAQEVVTKAVQLMPANPEARQAQSLLKTGQLLPRPLRPHGGTAPLRIASVKQLHEPKEESASGLDPVAEAAQRALTTLAEILFDYNEQSPAVQERRGFSAIVKGAGQASTDDAVQSQVVVHLGQAIDAQTKGQEAAAADELERVVDAGFKHAAVQFDLGYLRLKSDRLESAIRHLAHAVNDADYGLASRLLLGQILFKKEQFNDAALENLQALQLADTMTVPEDQSDGIRELYEPLIEAQHDQKDEDANRRLCENIRSLLVRPDWRDRIDQVREQTRKTPEDDGTAPLAALAEVMLEAQSSSVIDSIHRIHELARLGNLRSAMDEAYAAVQRAPTYLPLHILMGELLIQSGRTEDAITKFSVVAHAYGVRGEAAQAGKLWHRIIDLAPMNLSARTSLIDQLLGHGQVNEAIQEYLELANIYYRLAELDMARKTYTTALRVAQQANADRSWNVRILQHMADIDMQRLDWKQAVRVYEQLRTLRPDDEGVRKQLVELYTRLGQDHQTTAELESYLNYLESNGKSSESLGFLEELVKDHPERALFRRAYAEQLHRLGRTNEAVEQLDAVGEELLQAGMKQEAVEVITQILAMNPPNAPQYRQLLAQLAA